ncbi:helix-turn-helix transcriptional regulator [Streptomyces rhizosphaerihabitans]|uniref:helix-turn-helix transcriptional regulator n=1 Tax=Streptomyces rhizosphaerihabitans TaxID=1266770 RepID=UPI0021C0ED38|nr:helix-turn-helix transcriptional regulator [Streptomyces rhizosphaerihabitans]MCT9003335.1 helix-turn-helix transcriptional regulator [Streptomyces rhizosphaerihabitans]
MGRRLVGELLRIQRGRLGLTQKEAGELLLVSESCFGSYERAERIPPIQFLKDADNGLDARGALVACIEMMEEEKYAPLFVNWVRLERQARVISAYENMLIPGLLQTPAYALALHEARSTTTGVHGGGDRAACHGSTGTAGGVDAHPAAVRRLRDRRVGTGADSRR